MFCFLLNLKDVFENNIPHTLEIGNLFIVVHIQSIKKRIDMRCLKGIAVSVGRPSLSSLKAHLQQNLITLKHELD